MNSWSNFLIIFSTVLNVHSLSNTVTVYYIICNIAVHYSICLGQKEPINAQFFRLNSLYHFWNPKTRVYSNSALLFYAIKDDSCIFLAQTSYTLDRNGPSKWNFWTFELLSRLKFRKFVMPYFIPQVTFSLNFASLFNIMRDNSSVIFLAKTFYDFYNRSSSKWKISDFRLLTRFHQICTLIGSFCWKYIKFQLKKDRGVMSHDTEEWCKINLLFQNDKNLVNFDSSTHVCKVFIAICPFCAKYITFDQNKYTGVIFNDTEESCKIWRKTSLWLQKLHEKFGKFSPDHPKEVSKPRFLLVLFIQSRKYRSLKLTRVLCVLTMKNDAKLENELTCQFKTDMRNLINFNSSTWKIRANTL